MFYQSFQPQKNFIPSFEFPILVNKIEIDDSLIKIGSFSSRKKEFIGWGPMRTLMCDRNKYDTVDSKPVFLLSFGVWQTSESFQRIDYDILGVLGDVGGVLDSLLLIFTAIVIFLMQSQIDSNLVTIFKFLTRNNQFTKRALSIEDEKQSNLGSNKKPHDTGE